MKQRLLNILYCSLGAAILTVLLLCFINWSFSFLAHAEIRLFVVTVAVCGAVFHNKITKFITGVQPKWTK